MSDDEFKASWLKRMDGCIEQATVGRWTNIQAEGDSPVTRSSHGVSFNPEDGHLYLWGGEHEARHAIDSKLWRWSPETKAWGEVETKGDAPEPRVAHGQAILNNTLYVFGGRQGVDVGDGDLNDFWSINLESLEWVRIEAEGAPTPRSFLQACASNGQFHVFGGCDKGRLADLHSYDPSTGTWVRQPDNEKIRGRGGAGFIGGPDGASVFVLAGFAGEETNDCYKFDFGSKTWSDIPSDCLRKRSVFGLASLGKKIAIFGGEVDPSAAGHSGAGDFTNDVVCLDTETLTWNTVGVAANSDGVPVARGWTRVAAVSDNSFVLFGGLAGNDENPVRMNDLWQFTLE